MKRPPVKSADSEDQDKSAADCWEFLAPARRCQTMCAPRRAIRKRWSKHHHCRDGRKNKIFESSLQAPALSRFKEIRIEEDDSGNFKKHIKRKQVSDKHYPVHPDYGKHNNVNKIEFLVFVLNGEFARQAGSQKPQWI